VSRIKKQYVTPPKRLKVTSCHILHLHMFLLHPWSLYFLVCGVLPLTPYEAKKNYVSFIDNFSKFTWIYLLKFRSEVFQKFRDFQNLVERLFNRKIITMQTDWGEEYENLNSFFQSMGITHHVSCPHAHQQNACIKRKQRHIVEVGVSLLAHASMPLKFWDEAFVLTVHLINRTPNKVLHYITL
jgi:hypothetical protein